MRKLLFHVYCMWKYSDTNRTIHFTANAGGSTSGLGVETIPA